MKEKTTTEGEKSHDEKLTIGALKGRQSVRATFKLSPHSIHLLSIVSSRLGLKQKSLFDQLVEDGKMLEHIAAQIQPHEDERQERRAKTYVLSRRSLTTLNHAARTLNIPRDALVEFSIKRLLPVLTAEQKKQRIRENEAEKMERFLVHGQCLLDQAEAQLSKDDPLCRKLAEVITLYKKNMKDVKNIIEKGRELEQVAQYPS